MRNKDFSKKLDAYRDATYESGYYAAQGEDSEDLCKVAIFRRKNAERDLIEIVTDLEISLDMAGKLMLVLADMMTVIGETLLDDSSQYRSEIWCIYRDFTTQLGRLMKDGRDLAKSGAYSSEQGQDGCGLLS